MKKGGGEVKRGGGKEEDKKKKRGWNRNWQESDDWLYQQEGVENKTKW